MRIFGHYAIASGGCDAVGRELPCGVRAAPSAAAHARRFHKVCPLTHSTHLQAPQAPAQGPGFRTGGSVARLAGQRPRLCTNAGASVECIIERFACGPSPSLETIYRSWASAWTPVGQCIWCSPREEAHRGTMAGKGCIRIEDRTGSTARGNRNERGARKHERPTCCFGPTENISGTACL